MGWWRTGEDDDRIGDDGADTFVVAIRTLAERHARRGDGTLRLEEVLATAGAALAIDSGELVEDPESVAPGATVVAEMRDGTAVAPVPARDSLGEAAVRLLREAMDDVAADYLGSEMARRPRTRELLAVLAFALRVEAAPVISDAPEEIPIERLVLREAPA